MSARRNKNEPSTFEMPRRNGRKRIVWLAILLGLAAFVWFLPTLLVRSPLKQSAIEFVTSDINGSVAIKNVSAGWFSPIELNDVVLKDNSGNEILTAESIATTNSIVGFLGGNDLGKITIVRPTVDLLLRPNGSNLEDALAKYLDSSEAADSDTKSSELPRMKIEIAGGLIRLRSDALPQTGLLEQVDAVVECGHADAPVIASANMHCTVDQEKGLINFNVTADKGQTQLRGESLLAQFQIQQLPISALAPALTRIVGLTNCAGSIDANGQVEFDLAKSAIVLDLPNLNAQQIRFVAPEYLGQDQFVARSLTASGELQADSQSIFARQFHAESEFARFNADGQFDIQQLMQLAAGNELPNTGFQLDAAVDLAQVFAMLPETTHIRDGVKMNSGILQVTANTRNEVNFPRMVVNAEAANINFVVDGQNIVWNQPLRMVAVAATHDRQLMLEDIRIQSDFLVASGFAAFDKGRLQVNGDLRKMFGQLGQIIDLGDMQVGGQIEGETSWQLASAIENVQSESDLPVSLQGRFNIKKPVIKLPGLNRWQDEHLNLAFNANAITNTNGKLAINTGAFELQMGEEYATGELPEPIADIWNVTKYQFQCQANGSMARWIAQARNFVQFPEFFCDGNMTSQFLLTLNSKTVRLNQVKLEATDFRFNGFALDVHEPKLNARGHLKYHFTSGALQLAKTKLATASVSANTDELTFDFAEKILADGKITFRANANRASQWIGLSEPGDSIRWDGQATGSVTFDSKQGLFGGQLNLKVSDLVFVQPSNVPPQAGIQAAGNQTTYSEIWREPDIRLVSGIALTDDFDNLLVQRLHLKSKMADIQADGAINRLSSTMEADLTGRWNVDWENVNRTVAAMAGDVIEFQGTGWQPIAIKGPLYDSNSQYAWIPNQLNASATLNWSQAQALNLPLGTSRIDVRLNQSLATLTSANNLNIVDNFFRLQPVVDLRVADPVLHLQKGTMLDHWELTEEDSRTWLKYAAPLIADATSTQGQVSAHIESAAVPLFDPVKASANGALEVHNLAVGPGPLALQLLPLIDQIRALVKPDGSNLQDRTSWMQLPPQTLPFAVQEGRVHHDGFELHYKDVVIKTRGSVGFDQTMNLVADIPIQAAWVGDNRLLSRLIGKNISIPITGTLTKPRLDRRLVGQLTQQLVRESAMSAVQDKVSGEANKLQEKFGNKVQGELNRFQQNVDDKIKSEFEDKIQSGLNKLFGGDKNE